ncbi:MAG: hypothetical protein H7061_07300 [Bdellovibrionaceae bacterium]|nr:hypothetical protein [Bdellovibrio sp.]
MVSTLKAVLETIMNSHKKNSKLRVDVELSSGNVLERVAISEIDGEVLTLIMSEEKYYYNLNHVIGFSSSYDDHQ